MQTIGSRECRSEIYGRTKRLATAMPKFPDSWLTLVGGVLLTGVLRSRWRVKMGHNVRQDSQELFLSIGEGLLDLAPQDNAVCDLTSDAEGKFVFEIIDDAGSKGALPRDWPDIVTVVPICEWSFQLAVAEVLVPDEFGDLSLPAKPKRSMGERQKTQHEFAAVACGRCLRI